MYIHIQPYVTFNCNILYDSEHVKNNNKKKIKRLITKKKLNIKQFEYELIDRISVNIRNIIKEKVKKKKYIYVNYFNTISCRYLYVKCLKLISI